MPHTISALLAHRKLIPGAAKSNNANCFILQEILYKFSTKIININFTVCHTQNFTTFPLLHLVALDFYFPQELRQQLKFHALHKSLCATLSKLRMWKCTNPCMDNVGEQESTNGGDIECSSSVGGICRPDFTLSFAAGRKLMPYPAGLSACYTPLLCLPHFGIALVGNGAKSRGSWWKKTGRGQYFCGPLWPPDCPVLKSVSPAAASAVLVEVCFSVADTLLLLLAGDLKKVEFTATTNGLNSQLSLDKLKTNSCSLSKQRGGQQLFPNGHLVTVNLTFATIQPGGNAGNPHKQLPISG